MLLLFFLNKIKRLFFSFWLNKFCAILVSFQKKKVKKGGERTLIFVALLCCFSVRCLKKEVTVRENNSNDLFLYRRSPDWTVQAVWKNTLVVKKGFGCEGGSNAKKFQTKAMRQKKKVNEQTKKQRCFFT